jgi:hypothetical protein
MAKTKKMYRSMRGKPVDIELLAKKNELVPAVGNARVNARGDRLGPGGVIIEKREDMVKEYYNQVGSAKPKADTIGEESVVKETVADKPVVEKKKTTTKQKTASEIVEEELQSETQDEWVEDEDGNFVKRGE